MAMDLRKMKQQLEVTIQDVEKRLSKSVSLELQCMASEILDRHVSSTGLSLSLSHTHTEGNGSRQWGFHSWQVWYLSSLPHSDWFWYPPRLLCNENRVLFSRR